MLFNSKSPLINSCLYLMNNLLQHFKFYSSRHSCGRPYSWEVAYGIFHYMNKHKHLPCHCCCTLVACKATWILCLLVDSVAKIVSFCLTNQMSCACWIGLIRFGQRYGALSFSLIQMLEKEFVHVQKGSISSLVESDIQIIRWSFLPAPSSYQTPLLQANRSYSSTGLHSQSQRRLALAED